MAAGRAGDAVVVLEQSQVPPRLREPLEVLACQEAWDQVATVAMSSTHVSQSQAEEDFSRSVRDKKRETLKKKRSEEGKTAKNNTHDPV